MPSKTNHQREELLLDKKSQRRKLKKNLKMKVSGRGMKRFAKINKKEK